MISEQIDRNYGCMKGWLLSVLCEHKLIYSRSSER